MNDGLIERNFSALNEHAKIERARLDELKHIVDSQAQSIAQLRDQIIQLQSQNGQLFARLAGSGPTAGI